MKSTSSGRKPLSILLCLLLAAEGAAPAAWAAADQEPAPSLLLKYVAPSVADDSARDRLGPLPGLLRKELDVRWVAPPAAGPPPPDPARLFPEPDDSSLERISFTMAKVLRRMERMETKEAAALLREAESEARKFRVGEATRPLFSEIFLRRGQIHLWEGDRGKAGEWFARARALRPGFTPDPGLFSPAFLEAWARAGERPAPEAELLVQSIPPGASVLLDGKPAGTTPGRFKVPSVGPVRVRIALPGYQAAETAGQWLPGDSERIEVVLVRDRIATLGDLLAASPEGKGIGPLLSELAEGAGAARVALLVLASPGGEPVLRVYASGDRHPEPAFLGQFDWPPGEGAEEAAVRTAKLLRSAGWPAGKGLRSAGGKAWYETWWIWLLIGAAAAGVAAGAGGGGGGGGSTGSSTGSIGVTF
jgi:hypothetical protein